MNSQNISYNKSSSLLISSITFNGSNFACLDSNGTKIFLLDKCFNLLETIHLKYKYSSICYDRTDNCYWAISNNKASSLYKLDIYFKEIKNIFLKNAPNSPATSISYNYCEDIIWITFSSCIGYVKKGSTKLTYVGDEDSKRCNLAILSLPKAELISYEEKCNYFLTSCNEKGCFNIENCIPKGYVIEDMCMVECCESDGHEIYEICLLLYNPIYKKSFVIMYNITFCGYEVVNMDGEYIEELELSNYYCRKPNKKQCKDSCDKDCHDHCEPCDECCHKHCEPCDECCHNHCEPCDECCHNHCEPCDECCCNSKCYYKAKCKIIQSIALEEAALAHILNAEGEKIQKAVAKFESTDKLIDVNESVKETIIHITQLETQLYLKLESVLKDKLNNPCCSDKCSHHKPHC